MQPKKIVKILLFSFLGLLAIPISYLLIALFLSYIPVNHVNSSGEKTIFLGTNGVHLDLILPVSEIDPVLLADLNFQASDSFLAFGWGDENFYLHTPTWGDLKVSTAVNALFLDGSSLIHLSPYKKHQKEWAIIHVNVKELKALKAYLKNSFQLNDEGKKMLINGHSYGYGDSFYRAKGSYSFTKTCNTWINDGLRESGLPACYWTPFDFPLLSRYQ